MSLKPFPDVSSRTNEVVLIGNTRAHVDPFTGATQTEGRGGSRYRITCRWQDHYGDDASALRALASAMDGKTHRVYVPDFGSKAGGVGSLNSINVAPPLLAANFTTLNAELADSVHGVAVTQTRDGVVDGNDGYMSGFASVTTGRVYHLVVELHPLYFAPTFVEGGSDRNPQLGCQVADSETRLDLHLQPVFDGDRNYSPARCVASFVPENGVVIVAARTDVAHGNDRFLVSHFRAARGLVVDNGINLLGNNREFEVPSSWPASRAVVGLAAGERDPYGREEARYLEDTTDNDTHLIKQVFATSVGTTWVSGGFYAKADTLSAIQCSIQSDPGTGGIIGEFDLSTGSVINVRATGDWVSPSALITPARNGWYFISMTGLANHAGGTFATVQMTLLTHNGSTPVYAGTGQRVLIHAASVRFGLAPGREVYQPFSVVSGNDTPQTGRSLSVMGLDPGVPQQMKAGEPVEIMTTDGRSQLVRLDLDLDGDERGAGVMHFSPALRFSPPDGTALIVDRASALCMLEGVESGFSQRPFHDGGSFVDESVVFIEDVTV